MGTYIGGIAIGLVAGVLSGMVGIGGGIVIVPALVLLFGMDQKLAQGTSLAVLLPPTGVLAFVQYYKAGHVDIKVGVLIVLGLLIGGWFGAGYAQTLSQPVLRKIFSVALVLIATKMWFEK